MKQVNQSDGRVNCLCKSNSLENQMLNNCTSYSTGCDSKCKSKCLALSNSNACVDGCNPSSINIVSIQNSDGTFSCNCV